VASRLPQLAKKCYSSGGVLETDVAIEGDMPEPSTLYAETMAAQSTLADEDILRAQIYGLLSRALAEPPSDETLEILRGLQAVEGESPIGAAMASIGKIAVRTTRSSAEEEYSSLFHGMGSGGQVNPYASYYLTGFIYEKPLADLRSDLAEIGTSRSGVSDEPEDHIAFLCEVMHGLILGSFGDPASLAEQQAFFNRHISPWAGKVFEDIESAEAAALFMPVGSLGKLFIAVEIEAFDMGAA
jgi:TorA maturation chaperone TorD